MCRYVYASHSFIYWLVNFACIQFLLLMTYCCSMYALTGQYYSRDRTVHFLEVIIWWKAKVNLGRFLPNLLLLSQCRLKTLHNWGSAMWVIFWRIAEVCLCIDKIIQFLLLMMYCCSMCALTGQYYIIQFLLLMIYCCSMYALTGQYYSRHRTVQASIIVDIELSIFLRSLSDEKLR